MIKPEDIENVGLDTESLVYSTGNISGMAIVYFKEEEFSDFIKFDAVFIDNQTVHPIAFDEGQFELESYDGEALEVVRDMLAENLETNFGPVLHSLFD